jgi:hypothetical protein
MLPQADPEPSGFDVTPTGATETEPAGAPDVTRIMAAAATSFVGDGTHADVRFDLLRDECLSSSTLDVVRRLHRCGSDPRTGFVGTSSQVRAELLPDNAAQPPFIGQRCKAPCGPLATRRKRAREHLLHARLAHRRLVTPADHQRSQRDRLHDAEDNQQSQPHLGCSHLGRNE